MSLPCVAGHWLISWLPISCVVLLAFHLLPSVIRYWFCFNSETNCSGRRRTELLRSANAKRDSNWLLRYIHWRNRGRPKACGWLLQSRSQWLWHSRQHQCSNPVFATLQPIIKLLIIMLTYREEKTQRKSGCEWLFLQPWVWGSGATQLADRLLSTPEDQENCQ